MSNSNEEFARYANAERQLCDQAAPVLAAIIRAIEVQTGLCISELRVTVDRANRSNGVVPATCTIVRAHIAPSSDGDDTRSALRSTEPPGGGLSSNQDLS